MPTRPDDGLALDWRMRKLAALYDALDSVSRDRRVLVFPYPHDFPARALESLAVVAISGLDRFEFAPAPLTVGFRLRSVAGAAMPETTDDEYRSLGGAKHYVGCATQALRRPAMNPVAQPPSV